MRFALVTLVSAWAAFDQRLVSRLVVHCTMGSGSNQLSGILDGLDIGMAGSVHTKLKAQDASQLTGKSRRRDKSDRATTETVLDPRTCKACSWLSSAAVIG